MAVPDPEMDALRMMAYESRARSCNVHKRVPRRNDFIEVLWCLDHLPDLPVKWCPAEVLHITASPGQDCIATGIILYLPDETWDEQTHKVNFMENFKLRRAVETEECIKDEELGDLPLLDWKFSSSIETQSAGEDLEWTPMRGKNTSDLRGLDVRSDTVSKQQQDICALRNGHAALAIEVQKMKREVARISQQIFEGHRRLVSAGSDAFTAGAGSVLFRLRHKLALRSQTTLRPTQSMSRKRKVSSNENVGDLGHQNGDGICHGAMKARVECTLREFEAIALQIKTSMKPNAVWFFPDFAYTQLPLRSSAAFRILFTSFAELCRHISISSKSDRMELARKCGTCSQGDILRLLGTYQYDAENAAKPARIFLGSSCGSSHSENQDSRSNTSENTEDAAQHHHVLTRITREWDPVDRRFKNGLNNELIAPRKLDEATSDLEAFSLQWRRAPDLTSRTWSRSLTEPSEIFGLLEVSMPFIQAQGDHLCVEVGGLASDDIWNDIV